MSDFSKVRAVQHIMATLFSAQNALLELAPDVRWAGLGTPLGDYGTALEGASSCLEARN